MKKHFNHVQNRYYIKGELKLVSPMIIGCGENDKADIQAIRDWKGNFIIPGTTLAGNIKHNLTDREKRVGIVDNYFGFADDKSGHSLFIFHDAIDGNDAKVDIRDGVRLCSLTKTAVHGAKYDYEIVEEGSVFEFRMEALTREETDESEFEAVLCEIIKLLKGGDLRIGAKTSRGFGKVELIDTRIMKIDISNKDKRQEWINFTWDKLKDNYSCGEEDGNDLFEDQDKETLSVTFTIPDSLIIKSYTAEKDDVDSSSLTSLGVPIVPGTSWNGAIRHSMLNIGRAIGKTKEMQKIVREMLGWVYLKDDSFENHKKGDVIPSKVIIDESKIKDGKMIAYTRNKVDRFTGGVVDSALFDEKPVYGGTVTLNCEISKLEQYEKGMLILAFKELQNGIQTVGGDSNIGRGRLENKDSTFTDKDEEYLNALAKELNSAEQGGNNE